MLKKTSGCIFYMSYWNVILFRQQKPVKELFYYLFQFSTLFFAVYFFICSRNICISSTKQRWIESCLAV